MWVGGDGIVVAGNALVARDVDDDEQAPAAYDAWLCLWIGVRLTAPPCPAAEPGWSPVPADEVLRSPTGRRVD